MNYPAQYQEHVYDEVVPRGVPTDDGFWKDFNFAFTGREIFDLRHGFYLDVVMGGHPYLYKRSEKDTRPTPAGIALRLTTPKQDFLLAEPVYAELKLSGPPGTVVPKQLSPEAGTVRIEIDSPDGATSVLQPLYHVCVDGLTVLTADQPAIHQRPDVLGGNPRLCGLLQRNGAAEPGFGE